MTRAARRWLAAFVVCALAVGLCVAFIDRPLAEYADDHVVHTTSAAWLEGALRPLEGVALLALVALVAEGIRVMARKPANPRFRTPILCCWATMWAVAAEIILKRVFGRGWPDPTYIGQHEYGFHWFHGEAQWESFPSGTAMVAAAIVSVAWNRESRWRQRRQLRIIGSTIVVLISAALVAVNYHWLGDVVAGAYIGGLIGYLTVALLDEVDASVHSTGARGSAQRPRITTAQTATSGPPLS